MFPYQFSYTGFLAVIPTIYKKGRRNRPVHLLELAHHICRPRLYITQDDRKWRWHSIQPSCYRTPQLRSASEIPTQFLFRNLLAIFVDFNGHASLAELPDICRVSTYHQPNTYLSVYGDYRLIPEAETGRPFHSHHPGYTGDRYLWHPGFPEL